MARVSEPIDAGFSAAPEASVEPRSESRLARLPWGSFFIIVVLVLVALLAPLIAPHSPTEQSLPEQDPQTSLNPVFTIGDQLVEALRMRFVGGMAALRRLAEEALQRVRVAAPAQRLRAYPHQMSGGMKQRVVGAIAVAGEPRVVIADEPTTALDVTIQLQYLTLLKEIQARTRLAMLFITHDFGIVARMCDRVAVMYAGRIVESGPTRTLFRAPRHPYTEALMASVPRMEAAADRLPSIEGQPPPLHALPAGCRFASRCSYVDDRCRREYPPTVSVGPAHEVACWRAEPSPPPSR